MTTDHELLSGIIAELRAIGDSSMLEKEIKDANMFYRWANTIESEVKALRNGEHEPVISALTKQLNQDEDYLWSWHCNIAMAAYDEGLSHSAANRAASRFLSALGCNSEKIKHYADTQRPEPACKIIKSLGEIAGYYHDGPYRHGGIIGHLEAAISLINHIEHKKQIAEDIERSRQPLPLKPTGDL